MLVKKTMKIPRIYHTFFLSIMMLFLACLMLISWVQLDALGDTFGGVGERYPGNRQYSLGAALFFNIKLQKIFQTLQNHSQSLSTSKPIFQKLPFKNLFFNCDLNEIESTLRHENTLTRGFQQKVAQRLSNTNTPLDSL